MVDLEEAGRRIERVRTLMETFINGETTDDQRIRMLDELEELAFYIPNAMFNIISWDYKFELGGRPYTLQYNTTYNEYSLKSSREINLFCGSGEERELIKRRERKAPISDIVLEFLELIDSVKIGEFEIEDF